MPLPKLSDCEDHDTCCDALFTVLQDTSTHLFTALSNCLGDDECLEFNTYVSVNEPHDPQGDYLAVWVMRSNPILQAGGTLALQATPFPMPQATIGVKLLETGWPMLGGDGSVPSAAEMEHAAQHSYSHFEVVLRALYGGIRSRTLPGSGCSFVQMNEAAPTPRTAGLAGWITSYTIGLGW